MAREPHFVVKYSSYLGTAIKLVLYILKQLFAEVEVNSSADGYTRLAMTFCLDADTYGISNIRWSRPAFVRNSKPIGLSWTIRIVRCKVNYTRESGLRCTTGFSGFGGISDQSDDIFGEHISN